MDLKNRLGTFFILIGFVLLVLFFASDYLRAPQGWYLLIGAASFGFGIFLVAGTDKPKESNERFRLMRKMFGNDKKEKKDDNKKDDF